MYWDDPRLPKRVNDRLLSGEDQLYISAISAWEFEQKRVKRPEQFTQPFEVIARQIVHQPLAFDFDLYRYASSLPLIHKDPFDRMLIAQAIHHDLEFIASDETIHKYPVRIFW
jgi:PIN domain nuclease of toxin-antitoxin system